MYLSIQSPLFPRFIEGSLATLETFVLPDIVSRHFQSLRTGRLYLEVTGMNQHLGLDFGELALNI